MTRRGSSTPPPARTLARVAAAGALLALAACGGAPQSDQSELRYPTGAEDVIMRISFEGALSSPTANVVDLPALLLTGDGRIFQPGAVIAIYPGPLLPTVFVRRITTDGIEHLLARAEEHGLFTHRQYPSPADPILDVAETAVLIVGPDGPVEHRAAAFGHRASEELDPARAALASFVAEAIEYVSGPPDERLGEEEPFEPTEFLLRALLVGDGPGVEDPIQPRVVPWPSDAPIALDDEIDCAVIPAEPLASLFEQSDQLTWFSSDGLTYQLLVVPRLPGMSC